MQPFPRGVAWAGSGAWYKAAVRLRSWILPLALVALALAAVSFAGDARALGDALGRVAPGPVVGALALAVGNYLVRGARWLLYLRAVGAKVTPRHAWWVFVAGFSMAVTPAKLGELLKAGLLRDLDDVPIERTAPVVIAERVTDLVALVLLGLGGVAIYGVARGMVLAGAIAVALGLVVLAYRPLAHGILDRLERLGPLRRVVPKLRVMVDTLADLSRPAPLAWATALGVVGWLCECIGFAWIVRAFPGADVPLGLATLIYAATTIAGALSFLPGGLLVTEASMALLLMRGGHGIDAATATAATLITRLCTLWFGVVLGVGALLGVRRMIARRHVLASKA